MNDTAQKTRFITILTDQYTQLFESDPTYAYAKARNTPQQLAEKMTNSIINGTGNKDGTGIARTCKALGIKHTYKAISEFLNGGQQ